MVIVTFSMMMMNFAVCVRGGSQRSYSSAMLLLLQNGPNVTIVLTGHTSYTCTAQKSDL